MLDPQTAQRLLASATPQRPVQPERVVELAAHMRQGRWLLNGVPVIVAASGRLLDGRHRLLAGLQAGIAFPTILASGMAEDIVHLPGQPPPGDFAQILAARGIAQPRVVETLLARLLQLHDGTLASRHAGQSWSRMERVLRLNPQIAAIAGRPAPAGLPAMVGLMLLVIGGRHDPAALARLLAALADPALHAPDAPGAVLAAALARPRQDRSPNARFMRELAFCILALDAAQRGQAPGRMAWSPGRPFPALPGYPPLPGADWPAEAPVPPARPADANLPACTIALSMVTPAKARAMLAQARPGQDIQAGHVEAMADDMRAGRWALNPQPICVSAQGLLLNGAHRLRAVVAAGIAVELPILRGLPEAAGETHAGPSGHAEATPAILPGLGDAALIAAMANLLWRHEYCPPGPRPGKAPPAELRALLAEHPRLLDLRGFARRMVEYGTPSALGYAAYVIERENPVQGAAFLARLEGALAEPANHPVSRLRRRLLTMRRAGAGREAVLATVLDCFRAGREKG